MASGYSCAVMGQAPFSHDSIRLVVACCTEGIPGT